MFDKESMIESLIDRYGFSYAEAKKISDKEDALDVYNYIRRAYDKGRSSVADSYRYSGGL